MFIHRHTLRVRYAETDQMGYAYYGRYAEYFEEGRVESFRSLGINYKELEAQGILMPVLNLQINYFRPLFYDEEVTIETSIKQLPTLRIKFEYKVFNELKELTAEGETTLVFIDAATRKPIKLPAHVKTALENYFTFVDMYMLVLANFGYVRQ